MIENIIFDWSGTLDNNFDRHVKIYKLMFQEIDEREISREEIRKTFKVPYMEFWNHHFPNLSQEEEERLYLWADNKVDRGVNFYDGVKEVLKYLRDKSKSLFVMSSDPEERLKRRAREEGVIKLFTAIVAGVHRKHDKIDYLVDKYDLNLEETLYIGDTSGDVEEGKKAGVKTAGITWGFQNRDLLEKSDPDYLIDNIEELKQLL